MQSPGRSGAEQREVDVRVAEAREMNTEVASRRMRWSRAEEEKVEEKLQDGAGAGAASGQEGGSTAKPEQERREEGAGGQLLKAAEKFVRKTERHDSKASPFLTQLCTPSFAFLGPLSLLPSFSRKHEQAHKRISKHKKHI